LYLTETQVLQHHAKEEWSVKKVQMMQVVWVPVLLGLIVQDQILLEFLVHQDIIVLNEVILIQLNVPVELLTCISVRKIALYAL
jgi:hypothetical protein